ncbi:MAG TPA: nucleoside deaminase [Bacteroidales bacterium]
MFSHEYFMKEAYKEAEKALDKDEVPIGAVIVCNNIVIARAHNLTETLHDVTAHAEMQAITAASEYLGGKYLDQCSMYVTLEPCPMCAGALFWAQLGNLIYGASDDKRGYTLLKSNILHPKTLVVSGILRNESSQLIKTFFAKKRK